MNSSTEQKVILETTRTTSATMRMEHKTNFPDLPITFSQRTQTPTIPLVSEGTTMTDFRHETKKQTESTQTQSEPAFKLQQEPQPGPVKKPQPEAFKTQPEPAFKPLSDPLFKPQQPAPSSVPFPFSDSAEPIPVMQAPEPIKKSALEFFENNLKNLPPLQDDRYTRFEDTVKGSKTYVHKQNEVKEQFQSKLTEDLSYFNLKPEPPPEMGFMPKAQKAQPEKIVEKVKKLEEIHQTSETPLSGTVFPQGSFKKEEKFEKKEFLSTSTVSTSPFMPAKAASPVPPSTFIPQINQLFTADPKFMRSPSPKPSTEAVNMEKLWALKPKSPEPFSQHQQQSFSHEQKSSFVAYSSSQQTHTHHEVTPSKEHFVPIQPYAVEPQLPEELPKMSIKDQKSYFEQRIKQEEVQPTPELKAPGLVKQFAKPMVPLIPLDLEPGEAPEICYAPKPVLERKQSYVEKIEKSLEQNLEKEPERVPRGGIRILPQRQTPQRNVAPSPQRFQAAPSPKPVAPQAPPVVQHIIKPEPIVPQEPKILPEQFVPQILHEPFVSQVPPFEQFQSSQEFRSERMEFKKESTADFTGYRHVEPPKFAQRARSTDPAPLPPMQFELPKAPEPFIRPEPVKQPQIKREVPIAFQKPEPVRQQQQQPPREVPIAVQKPEQPKPNLQQHKPVSQSQPKPFITPKQKFSDVVKGTHETSESHSLYKNFVRSEESTHTSESYFQKIEQPQMVQPPHQQFTQPEPPKQQFVPPTQQVRKKHFPDVML